METATQTPYGPASQQRSVETLEPTNTRTAVHDALAQSEVGGQSRSGHLGQLL